MKKYAVLCCHSGEELGIKEDFKKFGLIVPLGIAERRPRNRKSSALVEEEFVLFSRFVFVPIESVYLSEILEDRRKPHLLKVGTEVALVRSEELAVFLEPIRFVNGEEKSKFTVGQEVWIDFYGADMRAKIVADGCVEFDFMGKAVRVVVDDEGMTAIPTRQKKG